jgi:hypothetical protein
MSEKITLVSSLYDARKYLESGFSLNNSSVFCCEKIAIKEYVNNGTHIVRIWRTYSLFDLWFCDFSCTSNNDIISVLDYEIIDDYLKITNITINDFELALLLKHSNYLNTIKANEMRKSILIYLINIAAQNYKNKIIIDVHRNLIIYKNLYMHFGFKLTNRKSKTIPNHIEIEFIL